MPLNVWPIIVTLILAILTNIVWAGILALKERIRTGKLRVAGHWAEYAADSKGREFSIGTIESPWWRRRVTFNGTNYRSDGTPFCHWTSTMAAIQPEKNQIIYSFDSVDVNNLQSSTTGFGVLNLRKRRDGSFEPQDGYFMYRGAKALAVSHSMVRIDEVPANRGDSAADILARAFPHEWKALNGEPAAEPKSLRVMKADVEAEDLAS